MMAEHSRLQYCNESNSSSIAHLFRASKALDVDSEAGKWSGTRGCHAPGRIDLSARPMPCLARLGRAWGVRLSNTMTSHQNENAARAA
jgi:hypothetical protein